MLIHYIFVRHDLPLGTLAAMVTHAAGESAVVYENKQSIWNLDSGPAFKGATAVVLEAHNEAHLNRIAEDLTKSKIEYIPIHESSGDYAGQFMAIGVVPGDREFLAPILREFQTLKTCKTEVDPMIKIAGLD